MSQPLPRRELRPPRQALRQRVSDVILTAAADVLATRREQASMSDVAAAAGVARATLYRYFPNRSALLERVAEIAVHDASQRLAASRVNEVPAVEGVARAIRALVDVGNPFIVLARERVTPDVEQLEQGVMGPLRTLVERGRAAGAIREDVPVPWLTDALLGVVASVLQSTPSLGREDTVAAITNLFLDGARARPRAVPNSS